ncbi:MAG: putative metal-binding motif-containing protein [Alphaproteobacteria bacterium]|nr:putative metal-binding motif-containing protein [Alphaproteobacteria bacterium]
MRSLPLLLVLAVACRNKELQDETGIVDPMPVDEDGDGTPATEDCDDTNPDMFPGNPEVCDGLDNNCDGFADENASDAGTWYPDGDGDGYGADAGAQTACEAPTGYVEVGGDCNDTDVSYHPGATEDDCSDPNDYNCDGSVGFADNDGDGYAACEECDDGDRAVNPSATEVCDDIDNNCDGQVDEDGAVDADTWYADTDGDAYGDPAAAVLSCDQPEGFVGDDSDCNDGDPGIHPGAEETCDEVDQDCDGTVDDNASDAETFYGDGDGDGYGDAGSVQRACEQPSGTVSDNSDCDDSDSAVNPGAAELCNGIDDNCDGTVDEDGAVDATLWYDDSDSDGYGDASASTRACSQPSGTVSDRSDCDDGDSAVNPAATEVCDNVDNDCDGTTDEDDAADASTWYADYDGDGEGATRLTLTQCDQPTGYVSNTDDCDDTDAAINTSAAEVCDGVDNDCDGLVDDDDSDVDTATGSTFYLDSDSDTYGDSASTTQACDAPSGYVADDTDCDDGDVAINPGAAEQCNGIDDDCDGVADSGLLGSDSLCAAESCNEILVTGSSTGDGSYYLDPTSTGTATLYTCDMTTDGGGWTLAVSWDRENDGETLPDFESTMTELFNNMGEWTEGSNYMQWSDYSNPHGCDVMSYEYDVEIPNGGEVLFDFHYYGYSMENSGTFFYIVDSAGTEEDMWCQDNAGATGDQCNYSASEYAYEPNYTCSTTSAGTYTWSTADIFTYSNEVDLFRITSLHEDGGHGDYSRLYYFDFWVR